MIEAIQQLRLPSESSANAVARYFEAKQIPRSAIEGSLLTALYQALSRSADTALDLLDSGISLPACDAVSNDKVTGLIVESRQHPLLATVVDQFVNHLDINVQVFHGTDNETFIHDSSIRLLINSGRVQLTQMGVKALSRRQYNAMFLSSDFWQSVIGRQKILVFQTDAILCENSDYQLNDFIEFDYIGSNWDQNRPVGIAIDGGNGGLSIRDWHAQQRCLEQFPASLWPGGEDGYFAFHLDLMGCKVARAQQCAKFSTQSEFLYASFGAHQIRNLAPSCLQKFLQYCPQAQATLS